VKDDETKDVTSHSWYTSGHYAVTAFEREKRPLLYPADGKPLRRGPRCIGFEPSPKEVTP
jgi:hypothetical protein